MKYIYQIVAPDSTSIISGVKSEVREFADTLTGDARTLVQNMLTGVIADDTWKSLAEHALQAHDVIIARVPDLLQTETPSHD